MSQENRSGLGHAITGYEPGLSEPQSYLEHEAALEATLFDPRGDRDEIVFELDAGELRVRGRSGH
jgi:hypothetical protein